MGGVGRDRDCKVGPGEEGGRPCERRGTSPRLWSLFGWGAYLREEQDVLTRGVISPRLCGIVTGEVGDTGD